MITTARQSVLTLPTKEYRGYRMPFLLYMNICELEGKLVRATDDAAQWKRLYEQKSAWLWRQAGKEQLLLERLQELAPEMFAVALLTTDMPL